ncbi:uncharacterized protein LOC108626137 isoform X2 [Ceratina calcarata]|uniref:Uncharacterized protein LOC108626137 isoform X2 n=1 Tax=Ceratina calcarata TaxID=156304 RepID=A0AAJ7WCF8_9HYME|nr:uncharacterized protein LOC108626137 isoform X2 [Ceratina calcarata]
MEQIDEVKSDINKTNSLIATDVDKELNTDDVKDVAHVPQDCTDNTTQDPSTLNKCDITDSVKEDDEVIETTDNDVINEADNNDPCITNEAKEKLQIEDVNQLAEVKVQSNSECTPDAILDEDGKKMPNNVETEQNIEEQNDSTVMNINAADDTNAQCQALIKSLSQTFEDKDQSLQATDADLSKLVDGNSEVMVLTVETINDSNEATEQNIVVTVHEEDPLAGNQSVVSVKHKEMKETDVVNEEFNLIENDGTIIEVIATEIVDTEIPDARTQEKRQDVNHTDSEKDSVTSTTPEVVNNPEVVDDTSIKDESMQKDCRKRYEEKSIGKSKKIKTEVCDSLHKINMKKEITYDTIVSPAPKDNAKEGNLFTSETNKVSPIKKRSVIQDIFDDWGDENTEDDNHSVSKAPDTVEIELKSLLNETKSQTIEEGTVVLVEEEITCIEKESVEEVESIFEAVKEEKKSRMPKDEQDDSQNVKKQHSQSSIIKSLKDKVNLSMSQSVGKSPNDTPVSRGRNLTSQIASSAEVTKALKERLREKQKMEPLQPDIFFVKKLTQRLSSKLTGGSGSVLPALIPLSQSPNCDKKATEDLSDTDTGKESNADNKELLAILEGDVDPDWSNLKPPTLTEEGKRPVKVDQSGYNTPPKLDPLVERELALKQLLELPVATGKNAKKKKPVKPTPSKASKEVKAKPTDAEKDFVKQEVEIDTINDPNESAEDSSSNHVSATVECHTGEESTEAQDARLDESRSGRKRKPTEKAREHEEQQSIVKRQKVYKSKVPSPKKLPPQANEVQVDNDSATENHVPKETNLPVNEKEVDDAKTDKQITNNNNKVTSKPPKQNLNKKNPSMPKRNIVVKKILRQNMPSNKKPAALKSKLNASPKKSGSKAASKSKKATKNNSGESKPKKKFINEIDRLLLDEGVVNLLYEVEQSDKKKLLSKSQTKQTYMDLQKVQRELKLRKKLVRNAVLRLRTSTTDVSKSPRSKRAAVYVSDGPVEKKVSDQGPLPKPPTNLPAQEFILPAKIRNAADASVIIRRHSSSSFSSASGSPRVSIDSQDKIDVAKVEESGTHSLRSTKRRISQEEKPNAKKSKKKAVQKNDPIDVSDTGKDKAASSARPSKKLNSKKPEKNSRQVETDETSTGFGKVVTRSNGAATANIFKTLESDIGKTKSDIRSQFSNKEINVRRHGNLVQLILTPSATTKTRNALTLPVMQEFREALSILKKDDDCRVVLLTSTGSSFCEGLELSPLLQVNKEERRNQAEQLADAVKDFIKCLASFNKPIVAGVQGSAVGLGVTMLPLFDLVIASDKATFNTPYGKLGQIAEGAAVFTLSHILGSAITSELLIGGRTLTASEALRAGLVTRVLWPDRFQVELLPSLKAMSEQSSQSMEATKTLLRHSLRKKLDAALESETYLLIQHWCSAECQTAIKAYIDGKIQ